MDASTLTFHRKLLRLFKGCISAYEQFVNAQHDDAMIRTLKAKKATLTREQIATNGQEK